MLWRSKVLFVYRKISNYSKTSDYGTFRKVESKYLSVKYLLSPDIIKHWHPSLSRSKTWFLGGPFGGVPGRWHPQTMSKYLSVKYLLISKKSRTLPWAIQKIDFWGVHLGGWHPQTMSKYLTGTYLLISKTTSILAWAVQKMDFLGPHFGGVPCGVGPKNFGRKNCICSSTTLLKN